MISLKERLTEILIKNKLLSEEDLKLALQTQKEKGGRLSDILVELNLIKKKDLFLALSEGLGLPPIDIKRFKIDPEVIKLIPKEVAINRQIIPVSKMGDTLTVAMADPLDVLAIDDLKNITGYNINPIIGQSDDIIEAISQYYQLEATATIDEIVKGMSSDSEIELIREEKEGQASDTEQVGLLIDDAPVIKITNIILEEAVRMGASDVLIEPWEKSLHIRYRIDGILQEREAPPKSMHSYIVSRIKVISELNIAEHRLPQDGRFKVKIERQEVDFRVSVLPSTFGEKVALRVLDKSKAMLDIERLGFNSDALVNLRKVALRPHGMILVCGPTGSGKTTTLYSLLKFIDTPEKNIVTVEDPIEYQLGGINQVSIRPEVGLTFASSLRSILRQDPDIIMVGEIRDFETVDIAIKAALTGHLVLSTLHTTTAAGAVVRLIDMGVEPFLLTSSLICILAQRLIRKVCPNCKEEYKMDEAVAAKLNINKNIPRPLVFFKGKGCKDCFNKGYRGRVGIAEVLVLSPQIRELILAGSQEHIIKAQARKEGMQTLREDGLSKASGGITTLEEVLRVTAPDE